MPVVRASVEIGGLVRVHLDGPDLPHVEPPAARSPGLPEVLGGEYPFGQARRLENAILRVEGDAVYALTLEKGPHSLPTLRRRIGDQEVAAVLGSDSDDRARPPLLQSLSRRGEMWFELIMLDAQRSDDADSEPAAAEGSLGSFLRDEVLLKTVEHSNVGTTVVRVRPAADASPILRDVLRRGMGPPDQGRRLHEDPADRRNRDRRDHPLE